MVLMVILMLVLVKCYNNKMVKATPHLYHPFFGSALGEYEHVIAPSMQSYKDKTQ